MTGRSATVAELLRKGQESATNRNGKQHDNNAQTQSHWNESLKYSALPAANCLTATHYENTNTSSRIKHPPPIRFVHSKKTHQSSSPYTPKPILLYATCN